ncbi:response regulator transcription factor [Pontiella sulfatireligans]|uniref:Response regulator ArlR n=1 Tax=Pontiella sulfatireligans TaxID=2750658 RepID=A0A6C2UTR4_9BACT|nr:response regulator [Pontiella sulfatireligans]VGO23559.1 Response regulator ArlR [Pontiella sulfatireligans]
MADGTDDSKDQANSSPDKEQANDLPRVLVVEDDVDFRWYIAFGLKSDYDVLQAADGQDGLDKAREYIPDLIVTDLMMPVMDGISFCREVKSNPETSHIPVIMLTAKTSVQSQVEGLQTGADDYVTKPFNMALLVARIHNLLESRRKLRERFIQDVMVPNQPQMELSPDQEFLRKIFEVLETHCADTDFSVELFAMKLNVGLRTLSRKLKALTGLTPAKMIWNVRLKKAAALLASSELRVTDIAYDVGFSDAAHFSRYFKQFYGMSPSEYRAKQTSPDTQE